MEHFSILALPPGCFLCHGTMRGLESRDPTCWGIFPCGAPVPQSVDGTPTLLDICPEGAGCVVFIAHFMSILTAYMTTFYFTLPFHKSLTLYYA